MFTKQDIIKACLLVWVIGSVVYIGYDAWNDYKIRGVQEAYQAGFSDSTKQLFDKFQVNQCKQTVKVNFQGNELELADVKCLQQQQPVANQQPQGAPQAPVTPIKK